MKATARAAAAAILLAAATASVGAQTPTSDFAAAATHVKAGDKVVVTDQQGREISGRLEVLSARSITVLTQEDRREIQAPEVRAIEGSGDPIFNGALIGAAITAPAAWFCYKLCDNFGAKGAIGEMIFGTALGALIDKIYDRTPIYVSPVAGPSSAGVAISVAFGRRRT